jgi:uncharacterized protein
MENQSHAKPYILGVSLLIGLTLLGFFIFKGLKTFSDKDRIVTVKGLAEINITATSATMSLNFSFSGDNLQEIIKQTEAKKESIIGYLTTLGYNKKDVYTNNIAIEDKEAYYAIEWQNGHQVKTKIDRYKTTQTIVIESKDIKATEDKVAQIKLDLISKGLTSTITANYSFPELNAIKPKLIAESTKNARVAGEQFANDSKAKLGKIKTASQGQITIAGKYQYEEEGAADNTEPTDPYIQKARVVSTIVFFLE